MVVDFCPGDSINVRYPFKKLVIKSDIFVSVQFHRDVNDFSLVLELSPLEKSSFNSD